MIQAVFQFEMLQAGRRRRGFFLRWLYAGFLLAQIAPIFFLSRPAWTRLLTSFNLYDFFESFLTQHYVVLALLTPAMVGGAVTDEKARGTLQYLLTANIRAGELILGKILAHVYQMMVLSLVGLPLLCFFAALAGDAAFPVAVFLSSLALVFTLAALSVLVSVWCRRTIDAVLCLYALVAIVIILVPALGATALGPWLATLNPLRVLALDDASLRWKHLGEFLLPWLSFGLACVVTASWRLRRAYRRQLQVPQRRVGRWWSGEHARVRGNPVLWREQVVEGIAPLEVLRRLPRWLGVVTATALSAALIGLLLVHFLPPTVSVWASIRAGEWTPFVAVAGDAFFWQGLAVLLMVTLLVAIRASASITGEKEKGTWMALFLTPLTTKKIVAGKHWGIFWAWVPYVAGHAVVTVPLAFFLGFEALTWAVLWMGAMLLAVILGSAVGLWASARAVSSWRSLLTTLALFYLGWLLFIVPVTIVLVVFKGVVALLLTVIGLFENTSGALAVVQSVSVLAWALFFGLPLAFLVLTHRLLASAAQRVGRNDRTMEGEFDYYVVYRDYYLKKQQEEKWEAPKIDLYELENAAQGDSRDFTVSGR
jgi:ABC-type transport system involved in multi-copper enzyme maturation permease subunit